MSAKFRSGCHLLLATMRGSKGGYIHKLPSVPHDHFAYVRELCDSKYLKQCKSKTAVLVGRKLYQQLPANKFDDLTLLTVSKQKLTVPTFDGIDSAESYCQEKGLTNMYILGGQQLANSAILHPALDSIIIRNYHWRPFANSVPFPAIPSYFYLASTIPAVNIKSPHTYIYNNVNKDVFREPHDTLGISLPPCGLFSPS